MPNGSAAHVDHRRTPHPASLDERSAASRSGRSRHSASIRTRALVRRLVDERDRPLAIIVAPPGYGKSTLVAEWARADERPFLWASAISGWSELARLIRSARHRHSSYVLVLESAEELEPDRLSEIVLAALNELAADSTIAVVSRSEPQLPLGRLRAHRMLTELRMGDLALSVAEGEALLRREGLELPTQVAQALVRRTEGWPAALQLAALCLGDGPMEIASFSGRQHLMFEYISEEVLAHLPSGLRGFATHTSVLEELCGLGCDAVLDEHGSGVRLAELAALSPLVAPVDPNHDRYRWHPLVREALYSSLHRGEPEQEPALHRRASVWYARGGDNRRALDHAAAARDAALTGDLLFENVVAYLGRGRHEMVEGWLTALGEDRVASYAPLALSCSLCCLVAGNVGEAKRWSISAMATAKRGHTGKNLRSLSTGLAVVQAFSQRVRLEAVSELADRALSTEPADSQWQPVLFLLRGVSAHLRGELHDAAETLDEGLCTTGDTAPIFTALCLAQRAMIAIEQREWELVAEATDRATMVIEEWGLTNEPIAALVFAAAGASRAHHGRVDEAKRDVCRGMKLLAALGDFVPWYGAEVRILLAHASLWLAGVVRARTLLAEASRLARKTPDAVIFAHWFDAAWAYVDTLAETRLAGPSALTIAELRVLRFLPSHRSFREIADQLEVSANTVKTQAHAVYRKLGVASRSEAVARALDAGLLG
jgi:LuxR family transcriptional regulator, maltose regulon positive regulatory protein